MYLDSILVRVEDDNTAPEFKVVLDEGELRSFV